MPRLACISRYDWVEACADEAIALQRQKPASLPGRDTVIYKTPFKDVLRVAQRYPLAPALIPDTPAAPPQAEAKGDGASLATQPVSAPPAQSNPAAPVPKSPSAVAPAATKAVAPASSLPVSIPKPKEPEKPIAPPPLPKDAAPASIEPKDMVLSKRFWGLAVTAVGTTNFLPRGVSEWINNEGNRELLTWLVVVAVGIILYKIGQAKAKRPLK
jgi:hypothetical protein